jgi:hypothetical protein
MKLSNVILPFFLVACNYAIAIPTISISSVSVDENVNGGIVALTVSLSAVSTQLVSVSVNTSNGTAIMGSESGWAEQALDGIGSLSYWHPQGGQFTHTIVWVKGNSSVQNSSITFIK